MDGGAATVALAYNRDPNIFERNIVIGHLTRNHPTTDYAEANKSFCRPWWFIYRGSVSSRPFYCYYKHNSSPANELLLNTKGIKFEAVAHYEDATPTFRWWRGLIAILVILVVALVVIHLPHRPVYTLTYDWWGTPIRTVAVHLWPPSVQWLIASLAYRSLEML